MAFHVCCNGSPEGTPRVGDIEQCRKSVPLVFLMAAEDLVEFGCIPPLRLCRGDWS